MICFFPLLSSPCPLAHCWTNTKSDHIWTQFRTPRWLPIHSQEKSESFLLLCSLSLAVSVPAAGTLCCFTTYQTLSCWRILYFMFVYLEYSISKYISNLFLQMLQIFVEVAPTHKYYRNQQPQRPLSINYSFRLTLDPNPHFPGNTRKRSSSSGLKLLCEKAKVLRLLWGPLRKSNFSLVKMEPKLYLSA